MNARVRVAIEYPGIGEDDGVVSPLGEDRFRLEHIPFHHIWCLEDDPSLPDYHDVIQSEKVDEKTIRFEQVVERAHFRKGVFMLSKEQAASEYLENALSKVGALGGHWERWFGGLLFIYLPQGVAYDPSQDPLGRLMEI